jgi:hypothetical protein
MMPENCCNYCIGGEFGISADLFLQPVAEQEVLPFGRKFHIYSDTGRSALYVALLEIIKRGGSKEAWLPRYSCDSVLLPFRQLGFSIHFYSMGRDLETLDRLPVRINSATFLFIHYFGKKNYPVTNWLNGLSPEERPLFVIEDCVQAALNGSIGSYGDFAIASYRKFFPQPDGAVLASDIPLAAHLAEPDENFVSERLAAKIVREGGGRPDAFLALLATAEERISNEITPRKMSWLSRYLFMRTDMKQIRRRRRGNWKYLFSRLKAEGLAGVHLFPIYETLEEDEVPLGLPILVDQAIRNDFRSYLMTHNIFCPIHWPLEDEERDAGWTCEHELSASMLTLPIDQRVTEPALDYMIDKMKIFFTR